jgi:hypothetical protein
MGSVRFDRTMLTNTTSSICSGEDNEEHELIYEPDVEEGGLDGGYWKM